jgi:hypothetical protein
VGLHPLERLMFMLSVDAEKFFADLRKHSQGGQISIEECLPPSRAGNHPSDQEGILLSTAKDFLTLFFDFLLDLSISRDVEESLYARLLFTTSNPRRSWTAFRMMDLPAPVSPVRILNPFEKDKLNSSIMAKFLIRSSSNIILK